MNAQPEWSDLKLLHAVAGSGSMLRAAHRFGLAASTVSRRLSALEAAVGALLVERGPGGVRLTEAGRSFAKCGSDFELGIARALRELPRAGGRLTGTVRVSAGDGFANVLTAAMRNVRERHPGIGFELVLEDRVVNLARREADVALRTVHRRESSLVYLKLRSLSYGLFADARYLAERGSPRKPADLEKHDWVGFAAPLDRLAAQRWLAAQCRKPPVLATTTFSAVLAAARAGFGLAVLPVVAAAPLLAVLPGTELPSLPVWLVVGRDARKQPHVAAFVEMVRAEFERGPESSSAATSR
jgi:DNA-binding transcriptional LysR family regulator